jgi:hypothetical protein
MIKRHLIICRVDAARVAVTESRLAADKHFIEWPFFTAHRYLHKRGQSPFSPIYSPFHIWSQKGSDPF